MASEEKLVQALDLLTITDLSTTAPRRRARGMRTHGAAPARKLRRVVDSKNVVADGISEKVTLGKRTGTLALTFYVRQKKPRSKLGVHVAAPSVIGSDVVGAEITTDVVAIGRPQLEEIEELANPLATRKPIQPGFSISHVDVAAGTLGCIVEKDGQFLILSNSHVLANSGQAKKGDVIVYPAIADDGKSPKDKIAKLANFIPFQVGGAFVNHVDCAVAMPLPGRVADLRSEIKDLFVPRGITQPVRDMEIVKVGRTTGETVGRVKDIHFRFVCPYPDIGDVGFVDQVFCTRYSSGGDSGSLVLDRKTGKAVGLHFAGFPDKQGVMGSVFNPIQKVLDALGVTLVTKALP